MLLHGTLSTQSKIDCMHELTHDLFERNFGPAPPWLNEGWAEYYSTIEIEPDRVRVGAALPHLTFTTDSQPFLARARDGSDVLAMPVTAVAPPSELLRLDREQFYASALGADPDEATHLRAMSLYLGSWALVHMLHDGPEPYPTRFKQFLQNVRRAPVENAWHSVFAQLSAADFDRDFRLYLTQRQLATFEYGRRQADTTPRVTTRALTDWEVHVLWARLTTWEGESAAIAEQDLDEAVAEAPAAAQAHYFRGLYAMGQHRFYDAEQDLSAAARLAPDDPRNLLAVLQLRAVEQPASEHPHAGDPVMQAAESLAKLARSPLQFRALALVYLNAGEAAQALVHAQRAVALAPIDSQSLDTEAQVLSALGRTAEAIEAERAAVAFLPEGAPATEITTRLHRYEARLRASP